jgi:hypothetical protein
LFSGKLVLIVIRSGVNPVKTGEKVCWEFGSAIGANFVEWRMGRRWVGPPQCSLMEQGPPIIDSNMNPKEELKHCSCRPISGSDLPPVPISLALIRSTNV